MVWDAAADDSTNWTGLTVFCSLEDWSIGWLALSFDTDILDGSLYLDWFTISYNLNNEQIWADNHSLF